MVVLSGSAEVEDVESIPSEVGEEATDVLAAVCTVVLAAVSSVTLVSMAGDVVVALKSVPVSSDCPQILRQPVHNSARVPVYAFQYTPVGIMTPAGSTTRDCCTQPLGITLERARPLHAKPDVDVSAWHSSCVLILYEPTGHSGCCNLSGIVW
jgi:hypothetical protein